MQGKNKINDFLHAALDQFVFIMTNQLVTVKKYFLFLYLLIFSLVGVVQYKCFKAFTLSYIKTTHIIVNLPLICSSIT